MKVRRNAAATRVRSQIVYGFTLIEVVVAISVVGVLALLALIAVQRGREASRRARCHNNLRQLGIAIHSYSSVINAFPHGINGRGFSIHTMLLPYLESGPVYNSINFDAMARPTRRFGFQNLTAFSTSIGLFVCPSEPLANHSGRVSYAGNRGTGVQKSGYDGAFVFERRGLIGYSGFTDGTSATAAMAEWITGSGSRGEPGRLVFETEYPLIKPDQFDAFLALCSGTDPLHGKLSPLIKGESWLVGELSYTLYNHTLPINQVSCTNGALVQQGAWTAGSFHGGGANVLFVDGHVVFVRSGISLANWRAIGSRNGGEVLDSSSL